MSENNSSATKCERASIVFCDAVKVDGYRMPDGSFRVGITTASTVVGFAENYLRRILKTGSGTGMEALRSAGFDGKTEQSVRETLRGDREEKTISLSDFAAFIAFGLMSRKKEALALHRSLTELSLLDFFRDGFGDRPLSIEEKRTQFYQIYSKTVNWFQEDREDWALIEDLERQIASASN